MVDRAAACNMHLSCDLAHHLGQDKMTGIEAHSPLLIQLLARGLGKASADGPSDWAAAS